MPNMARSAIAMFAAIFIGLHRPAAADRRQRRDAREGHAMPSSSGKPLTKGWSARAKTNGSTGRMQGLAMVSTPPI